MFYHSIKLIVSIVILLGLLPSESVQDVEIVNGKTKQYLLEDTFKSFTSCKPALSIQFVIDVTESQFDKLEFAQKDLTESIKLIQKTFPNTQYSISTFTDKPIKPLGFNTPNWVDYCYKIRTNFNDSYTSSLDVLNSLTIGGGIDFSESQFSSYIRAGLAPQIQWRPDGVLPDGTPHIKVLVLITDAYSHMPGDAKAAAAIDELYKDKNIAPFALDSSLLVDDPNALCDAIDYPSLDTVKEMINDKHYLPIVIVAPAYYICDEGHCPYPELTIEAVRRNDKDYSDPYLGMKKYYTAALKDMEVTGFVQPTDNTPIEFSKKFVKALEDLTDLSAYCQEPKPTTTPSPTVTQTPRTETTRICEPCDHDDCCGNVDIKVNITVS